MPLHRQAAAVLISLTFIAAVVPVAAVAADEAPASGKANTVSAKSPPRFDVKKASCQQFLDLPQDVRGLVVAWSAGRYGRRSERWIVEENVAPKVVTKMEKACADSPDASFWYKIIPQLKEEAKATKTAANKK